MRIPKFSIVLHLAVKAIFHLLQYCLADQLAGQLLLIVLILIFQYVLS